MTFTVYYTDRDQPDSTAIDRAWHNNQTNTLTLELHGTVYEYYDVTESVFEDLLDAGSPGTYYRNNIRGAYKGSRLGPVSDMREQKVEEPLAQWERELLDNEPTCIEFHNGGYIDRSGDASFPEAKVNDLTKVKRISLSKGASVSPKDTYAYTVQFVVMDGDNESAEREHTLQAKSLDDALEQMWGFAALFDQTLVLKGASVRFD